MVSRTDRPVIAVDLGHKATKQTNETESYAKEGKSGFIYYLAELISCLSRANM